MLSVITPSRGRPDLAEKHLQSILSTASSPSNVELLFYVDSNDPKVEEYKQRLGNISGVDVYIGPHCKSIGVCWNILARKARGNLIMMGNDDFLYVSENWDKMFEDFASRVPDGIFVLCSLYPDKSCSWFPVVSRRWVELLGALTSESFRLEFHDQWMIRIAVNLGRFGVLSDITTLHEPAFDTVRASYGPFEDVVNWDRNILLEEEKLGISQRLENILRGHITHDPLSLPVDVRDTFEFYSTAYKTGRFDKVDLVSRRPLVY